MAPPRAPQPPRVVVDSNVIVSALHAGGAPEEVVDLARAGTIQLFFSPYILDEVAEALARDKFGWAERVIVDALRGLPGTLVDAGPPHLKVLPDPDDDRILECAVAAKARYIITGDRHLLDHRAYRRIRILNPRDFLSLIAARTAS